MTSNRELRQKIFIAVHDFLLDNYDCDCPRIDPEGSHTAEAQKLTQLILSVVDAQEIREDGAGDNYSGAPVGELDLTLELRRYYRNRALAAKVYIESARRLGKPVPDNIHKYAQQGEN